MIALYNHKTKELLKVEGGCSLCVLIPSSDDFANFTINGKNYCNAGELRIDGPTIITPIQVVTFRVNKTSLTFTVEKEI